MNNFTSPQRKQEQLLPVLALRAGAVVLVDFDDAANCNSRVWIFLF